MSLNVCVCVWKMRKSNWPILYYFSSINQIFLFFFFIYRLPVVSDCPAGQTARVTSNLHSSSSSTMAVTRVPSPPLSEVNTPVAENWCYTQVSACSYIYTYKSVMNDVKSLLNSIYKTKKLYFVLHTCTHVPACEVFHCIRMRYQLKIFVYKCHVKYFLYGTQKYMLAKCIVNLIYK